MIKKIFIITIVILALTGCSEETVEEASNPYQYDINLSQSFSNDDLIYSIMIDRFYDGDESNNNFEDSSEDPTDLKSYLGGDLQGIIDKLDYIKNLGVTTIWITPVAKNEPFGYHGYWIEDFKRVDPHFGDMSILKEFVSKAHEKDMKVILDYVVNHTGYNHPWTTDTTKKDWFHNLGDLTNDKDKFQVENHNLAGLPDLNTENPQVKAYFFDNALWWIRETGVDGFRLDTVKHVPKEFWNEFAYVIKQEYPNFYFLGEVFNTSASYIESYHETGLDGLTNYSIYSGIEDTFKLYGDANKLKIAINNETKYSNPELNGVFLDNHDVSRLISRTSDNGEIYLKQSLTFVMTYPAIPIIYYGTEIGLEGKSDPDNRRLMAWDQVGNNIYSYYQSLVKLRKDMDGFDSLEVIHSNKDHIAIKYSNGESSYLILYNISTTDIELDLGLEKYTNYFTNETVDLSQKYILKGLDTVILKEN